ncbi:oligoendopeptidase F [Christensenella tenuis]|uniref:Oligopeptidase F n=1 Tax=Christensenella tenuis TaxID=2763033 RepID=A0ABR7EEX3_9FIRM|nr:oligoendopeptidase F [Christensenella tenuis]MBC5648301.1 oligoendopeptidase F [Christensenella tenuis]
MEEKTRDQIDQKYKWVLEDIYATDEAWEEDYKKLEKLMEGIPHIQKTLTKDEKSLASALHDMEQMEHIAGNLFVYARMRRDENNADTAYQAQTARAMDINVRLGSALSFVSPALLALKPGVLTGYIEAAVPHCKKGRNPKTCKKGGHCSKCGNHTHGNKNLAPYDFMLKELVRGKKHVLSKKEERLLSMTADIAGAPKDIFTMIDNADMKFGTVKDADGKCVQLSHGKYIVMMQSPDRDVRKKTYETYYKSYKDMINTISAAYSASVKKDVFYARAKKFGSALEKSLFSDNVPVALYDNLIETIHKNLPIMYRYVDVRKKALGLTDLAMYDIYTPLAKETHGEYSYEQSMELVKKGLAVLGEEYGNLLQEAQDAGWIDVYETPGKTSGAYSWGVFGVHPYVLLNHRGDLDSVFTIAHELGHAMHTYHSNKNQPEAKAGYEIFVAEVASTVNEILLTHYLLGTEQDADARRYILNHYLDQFRTTVVRQTMFAEFEKMTHAAVEAGEALTHESLCRMYGDLNALYYGPEIARDDTISFEWSRIPHFYNAFYVYKYATGFSCAVKIASDILSGRKNAVGDYIRFLSSGGSDYPLELLKIAHVDLAGGEPVDVCMQEFAKALDEFEQML